MNRQLTPKELRTIRIAVVGVILYLAFLYGPAAVNYFTARREAYDQLAQQARDLRAVIKPYEAKVETATNLMEHFHLDPAKLNRSSVMAEVSAAIQKAAASEGVGVGPIRETAARPSAKEAGTIQFEGGGQITAIMGLLHHLDSVGFPVIIDNLQLTSDPRMPGNLKVSMTIVVLDFEAWKPKEEQSHV